MIEMAKKCGWDNPAINMSPLYEFAKLVAEHERERCAEICDVLAVHPEYASSITKLAAQAIRNRGQS